MNKEELQRLKEINRSEVLDTFIETIKSEENDKCLDYNYASILGAFIILKIQQHKDKSIDTFQDFSNVYKDEDEATNVIYIADIWLTGTDTGDYDTWNRLMSLKNKFSNDQLMACILFDYMDDDLYIMPESLVELTCTALKIDENSTVADLTNGNYSFVKEMKLGYLESNCIVNGDRDFIGYNFMLADILKGNITTSSDVINEDEKYDRVFFKDLFSNDNVKLKNSYEKFFDDTEEWTNEWINCRIAIHKMKQNGKAAVIMLNAPATNKKDMDARKFLIEHGYVETVIALPEKIFECDWAPTTLIIFSENNTQTTFIDARDIRTSGRIKGKKVNFFSHEDISKIMSCVGKETSISRVVSKEEINENEYIFNPTRYINVQGHKDTVEFGKLIKSVTRGIQFSAKEIDDAKNPDGIEYVMPSDIKDGLIDSELVRVTVESKYDKFRAGDGYLLLSRIGDAANNPFRVAVCDRPVLANGNLYVIKLNKSMSNPYYIKSFFESPQGLEELSKYSTGDKTPTLGVGELKKIRIPYVSLKEQNQIGAKVKENLDAVKHYKNEINKLKKIWLYNTKGETVMKHEFLFILKEELERKGFALNVEKDAVQQRKQGKNFTFDDHMKAFIYALLSNQRKWGEIVPKLEDIDKLFFNYDVEKIKEKDGEYFKNGIRELKCGNISIKAQMRELHNNINTFEKIIKEYGDLDKFIKSYSAKEVVGFLSNISSEYKLKQMGEALIWEYLRNVGVDGVKPDAHLKRFFGCERVSASNYKAATNNEVYDIVEALSQKSGLGRSEIDAIIWMYCADDYVEVCTANPKCDECVIKEFCNKGKKLL